MQDTEYEHGRLPIKILEYPDKITATFREELNRSDEGEFFNLILECTHQLDLMEFSKTLETVPSKKMRRKTVVDALHTVSIKYSNPVRNLLASLEERGLVKNSKCLSVRNVVITLAVTSAMEELLSCREVARIVPEFVGELGFRSEGIDQPGIVNQSDFKYQWWPMALGVKNIWRKNIDGTGVIVGIIDTGVMGTHEQLRGKKMPAPRGWFDPYFQSIDPTDSDSHGTSVLSCAVGQNPHGKLVGVAPGAQWIAAQAFLTKRYNNIKMAECADWMLNSGQPDVLICSWGHDSGACNDLDRHYVNAWKAAEIFCLFAAGNDGPDPSTDISPANLTNMYPGNGLVFSVGGIAFGPRIYRKSSRGPSSCDDKSLFPQITAPSQELYCAFTTADDGYILRNGTSYGNGLAAGLVALLIQKYPECTIDKLEQMIRANARDMGVPGPDNDFGYGLIQFPPL